MLSQTDLVHHDLKPVVMDVTHHMETWHKYYLETQRCKQININRFTMCLLCCVKYMICRAMEKRTAHTVVHMHVRPVFIMINS